MKLDFLCAIAYNWHDSSVSFAINNRIVLVLEAERVFRKKKLMCSVNQMEFLVNYGCRVLGRKIDDITLYALQTLGNPHLTDEQKVSREPFWAEIQLFGGKRNCLIVNHHLAHASAFLYSPFSEALVLTCDGGGDFGERVTGYYGNGTELKKLDLKNDEFISAKVYDLCSSHLYSNIRPTKDPYLSPPRAEGKMMALAAYGNATPKYINILRKFERELSTTTYQKGFDLLSSVAPELLGEGSNCTVESMNFAASVNDYFIERRKEDVSQYMKLNLSSNLVLTGGAHLNLELNTEISKMHPNLFIPPCCDDTGISLGSLAILISKLYRVRPKLKLPFLGEGNKMSTNEKESTIDYLVEKLKKDYILLIHNGKSEIGPRALGNRSFIARADSIKVKNMLSEKVKQREWYRPVAPIITRENVKDYYIGPEESPFMLFSYEATTKAHNFLPSTIHVNSTARVQTVSNNENPFIHKLLRCWGNESGHPVLLNTSLNLRGMPLSNKSNETIKISKKIPYNNTIIVDGEIL